MKFIFILLVQVFVKVNAWCNRNHQGDCFLHIRGGDRQMQSDDDFGESVNGISFMKDHSEESLGKISLFSESDSDPSSQSRFEISIGEEKLVFFADGKLRTKKIDIEQFNSNELQLQQFKINDLQVVEAGEVIEGLTELTFDVNDHDEKILRISNMAKQNSLVISEESYVGLGTKWPSVRLDVNGGIQGTSAYSAASDERLKENVKDISPISAMQIVNQLNGVTFDWKTNVTNSSKKLEVKVKENPGFLAQQVEKILPQIVATDHEGFKSVRYSSVIPYLVESIKYLEQRIKKLEEMECNCN